MNGYLNIIKRFTAMLLCAVMILVMPLSVYADKDDEGNTVKVEIDDALFTERRTMHALSSIQPDMSLRPETRPWTDTVNNMWGVGLNSVDHSDVETVYAENHPYTLVGNGLCSRIMVQFDDVIPRALHPGEDPSDPDIIRTRSVDVAGQYKLKDENGAVFYTYCVDVATDANLYDVYNGMNVEDADYYSSQDAAHIRYICLNGYWGAQEGLGSMEYFTAPMVSAGVLTEEEAASLTPGEAMTATQAAIWEFGNSDLSFSVDENVVTGPALKSYYFSSMDFEWLENYLNTNNLIKKIFDFLIAGTVESSAQITVLTRNNSLENFSIDVKDRVSTGEYTDEDIYNAVLSFSMGTEVLEDDDLTVCVFQDGEELAQVPLVPGKSTYTLDKMQLSENSTITFSVEGTRELSAGVYIFEAEDTSVSQTLVGVAAGVQHVGLSRGLRFSVDPESPNTGDIYGQADWVILQVFSFAFMVSAIVALPRYVYRRSRR